MVVIVVMGLAMVAGVKSPVWAGAVVNISVKVLGIVILADMFVVTDALAGVVVVVIISFSLDVLSDVVIHEWIEALPGVRAGVIIGFVVLAIGVDVLVAASVNIFAVRVAALRRVTPTPTEAFSRCSMPVFDCARVLQARMPSDHV